MASVNLFGAIRVTKAFLPLIRHSRGRIVNVSSELGRFVLPLMGPYCATKFALEAFTEALRLEMKRFGVKVCSVQPGNFTAVTDINGKAGPIPRVEAFWSRLDDEIRRDYGGRDILNETIHSVEMVLKTSVSFFFFFFFFPKIHFIFNLKKNKDVEPVIGAIAGAVTSLHPADRYWVSQWGTKALVMAYHFLPTWLFDFFFF